MNKGAHRLIPNPQSLIPILFCLLLSSFPMLESHRALKYDASELHSGGFKWYG